jgi:tRNA nucleotidyltransferase (CCA-adding enzyme)
VAAALSLDNMCIFIDRASEFLEKPDETFFQPPVIEPLGDGGFRTILEQRGTSVIALEFEAPNEVEDILFPQLHKLEGSICEMFERYDFCVYNSGVWASGKAVVLFELESAALSNVRKHTGPHVWWGTHALAFKSKYKDADTFSNVYIMKGKYMVDIPRKFTDARSLIRSEILNCSLGRQVASSVKKEYRVLEDMEILDIKVDDFRRFLRKFFEK